MAAAAPEPRPLRADAERNRRRIRDAARAVFAEHGLGVGVDVVAREARVGVGTIYRRFPTKDDLLSAIVEDQIDALRTQVAEAERAHDGDPWEALSAAGAAVAGSIAVDQGFYQALSAATGTALAAPVCARNATVAALEPLVVRAQAAGVLREDVVASDLVSLCALAAKMPRWRLEHQPELWRRYLAIVFDGLRPAAAHPLPHAPADESVTAPAAPAAPAARAKGA